MLILHERSGPRSVSDLFYFFKSTRPSLVRQIFVLAGRNVADANSTATGDCSASGERCHGFSRRPGGSGGDDKVRKDPGGLHPVGGRLLRSSVRQTTHW